MNLFGPDGGTRKTAMKTSALVAAIVTIGVSLPSLGQQSVIVDPYMAVLQNDPTTIGPGKAATLDISVGSQGMAGMQMKANLGNWSANREGSGTSWQPDSSPMFMKMLPSLGGFEFGTMGTANSNALLAEATYYHAKEAFFIRFERVDKDELLDVPAGNYTISKLLFGGIHNFYSKDRLDYGLGAYAGVYSFPRSLNDFYGIHPLTLGVFLRVRPSNR